MPKAVDRLADIIIERTSAPRHTVLQAVGEVPRSAATLGRLASQIASVPGWPETVVIGEVVFELASALRRYGIDIPLITCVGCDRLTPFAYLASEGPSCRPCGPRGTVQCAAGLHPIPAFARNCKDCRDIWARKILIGAAVEVGATIAQAESAVEAPNSYLHRISAAKWLAEGNGLGGQDPGPDSVQRIRRHLADLGCISPATCVSCGKARELRYKVGNGRVCTVCFLAANKETCTQCRKTRPVIWRDPEGRPWCDLCRKSHDDRIAKCSRCGKKCFIVLDDSGGGVGACCYTTPEEICAGCGEDRSVWARRSDGVFCQKCFRLPVATCARCDCRRPIPSGWTRGRRGWCIKCCRISLVDGDEGALIVGGPCADCQRDTKIQAHLPDGPRCATCYDAALNRREPCCRCGELRRVFFRPGVCSACLGVDVGHVCVTCGGEERLYESGRCPRCALNSRVDEIFARLQGDLTGLADRIRATESPKATLHWLVHGRSWRLISEALVGDSEITHELLDDSLATTDMSGRAAAGHDVEYACALLISAGALPARKELTARFQQWAERALTAVSSASERWTVRRFCRERLVPTLERQEQAGKGTTGSIRWAQARLRATIQFSQWLKPRGGIAALNQKMLDEWLAGSTPRFNVRDFVRWAIRERIIDMSLRAMPLRNVRTPAETVDYDDRSALAKRLLWDDGIATGDRSAALLIVLYGQHLSRIVRLTTAHVRLRPTRVRLGIDWLDVPQPMDGYVEDLFASADRQGVGAGEKWLFPGVRPGWHLSEDALSKRLHAIGLVARPMRNAALFHLATSVQPHTLYRLLGLHPNTAVAWSRVAGSVYASYWADVAEEDLTIDSEDLDDESREGQVLEDLGILEHSDEFR